MTTLLFAAAAVAAALEPSAAAAVTTEAYPDADTVLVNEIEKVEYFPDGTSETWDESWTKILTEKGRRDESTATLDYSRRYGTGEIAYVGAIGTNGVERQIDVSKTTKDSTDNSSMAMNIYDPLDRKIVCRIPGLAIGETLHLKTHRKALKPRTEGKWADLTVMEWRCPILRATYEVKAPAALPIRRKAVRHPLGNVVAAERTLADGSVLHTFTVTNSPQAFPEPDMPPLYTQVQHVRLSTARDWPEISSWYWALSEAHLAKTNAAMVAKVRELAAAAKAAAKAARPTPPPHDDPVVDATSPGYAPHDVDITFDNRYGVCRDKAALLVAMLRLAGIRAYPVLIHVGAKLDPEIPQPFFNHAIVAVETAPRAYRLMDPTNENTKDLFPAYLCNSSYLVARPDGETLKTSPVAPPEQNSLDVVSRGSLAKDGSIFLKNEISFTGINDTAYRSMLVKRKPEDRVKFFERCVKSLSPGAELVSCEIAPADLRDTERPLAVSLAAKLPEMVLKGKTRDFLSVPFVSKGLGVVNFLLAGDTSLERRKYTLALDTTARVSETLSLDLGEALGPVAELPPDIADEKTGLCVYRRFAVTNGVFSAERRLAVAAVEFEPDAYLRLREGVKRLEAAERRRPVFAADALSEAHFRCLLDAHETTVASDRAWVTTNTVVKQVLTYDGKRKSAELKFDFNPTWKSVALVSAVVSNRNGSVRAATQKEMNVMDCGWAAAAPRYPAGKTLVVNLPSVEIGSVISYTTVVTVTNAPAPFYATYAFDAYEPVDCRRVRVNDWSREVRDLKPLPNEPGQPYAALWRDEVVVSSNRFAAIDLAIGRVSPRRLSRLIGPSDRARPRLDRLRAIRDWMAKNVRVIGPGLYDVPLDRQLTPPETVIREGYAARLDYVRTLCALARAAGFDADVVLAANNADEPAVLRERDRLTRPNLRAFSTPLCRVRLTEGDFLGFGGETRVYFIGTESQYAPLGPTPFVDCDFFDPAAAEFGLVTVPDDAMRPLDTCATDITLRENGAADMTVVAQKWGPGVGAFRKKYAEMLPEDRSRHYQALLGGIAQAASATAELVTDVEGYPAARSFSCYVPDYAVVGKDSISLQLPPLDCPLPTFTGSVRRSPFAVSDTTPEEQRFSITFPEGYVKIDHLPESFVFEDPFSPGRLWLESRVASSVKAGVLTVTVVRVTKTRPYSFYPARILELVRDWRRIGTSRANRTIVIRK